jgi:HEAT repeat protein
MMGGMDAVRYPAAKKCATPARGLLLLLVLGCQPKSPIEGKSVAEWEKQLRDGDTTAQAQAGLALAKLGPEAAAVTPALADALKNPTLLVRQNAALALGAIGPDARSAVKELTTALMDSEWQVRRLAAQALGKIGRDAREARPALQKAVNDKHGLVQQAAKEALKQIGAG